MFSRQHYKAIGYLLAKHQARQELIEDFMHFFKEDNPRFDRDRFQEFILKEGSKL
jgi:hypothetical protein